MANVNIDRKSLKPQKTVIQDMTFVAPNREAKDVGKLKQGILKAESIYVPNRTQLYDIYHDVVTIDGHLSGIMRKRIASVANKSLKFIGANGKKVDEMDKLITSKKFKKLIKLIIEKEYWGVSGVEFIVGDKFNYNTIDRKHIRVETGFITKSQYDYEGFRIDELPMIWILGEKYDLGLLLHCSMYAIYKRSGFADFAQYVEIFGQPVRVIYYDAYDERTKTQLRQILNESGSSLAMMIPKQAQFQMLDGKTSNGNGELQVSLIKACNDEMDVAILGNTETTSSSKSSGYAQSQTHAEQQLEITKDDISNVESELNSDFFIGILKGYGYPVDGGHFEFEKELNLDNLTKRIAIDIQVSTKVPIGDDYYYETYGIPKPDNYDELKAKQEADRKAALEAMQASKETPPNNDVGTATATNNEKQDAKTKKGKTLLAALADFFGLPRGNGAPLEF